MSKTAYKPKFRYFMGDFETTVYDGQERTDVWASAVVEFYTEDVKILPSINETWNFLIDTPGNVCIFYHNLKFDGTFWIDYFLSVLNLPQAVDDPLSAKPAFLNDKEMPEGSFKYVISDDGNWYYILVRIGRRFIMIRDSMKLLPFSVRKLGKEFGTKHRKSPEIEYSGFRFPGCEISETEQEYIKNDVLVVKEALEIMFEEGHDKLTIGSCCLAEYKSILNHFGNTYKALFPDLYSVSLDPDTFGACNADENIRKSYRGGWVYLVPEKAQKLFSAQLYGSSVKYAGLTADVNSLYPSEMSSESGSAYPVGLPDFWSGDFIPDQAKDGKHYYFVRFSCRFRIKPGFLPFVQIKNNLLYNPREMLKTSDIYDRVSGRFVKSITFPDGTIRDSHVIITMTETDFELFKRHYDTKDFRILDGCFFRKFSGLFDEYINKYSKIKQASTGARRALAKLFLNNLYGKMAASKVSDFKFITLEDERICYNSIEDDSKNPGYIAVGSAITAYARRFTINAAQANYYGPDKPGFIYADTDSIHCDISPEMLVNVPIHPSKFCHWKIENLWRQGWYVRPKTYIEETVVQDGEPVDPFFLVKCAGMPDRSKNIFLQNMKSITDFNYGLKVAGKLVPKRVPGGVVLVDSFYEMKKGREY